MHKLIAISLIFTSACSLEINDLNHPSLAELEERPTPELVRAAATGLLVALRDEVATDNGFVATLGVLGREAFLFSAADPGFVTELLQREPGLDPGSNVSGAAFWLRRYRNMHNAQNLEEALEVVPMLSEEEKHAIRGFARTIRALELLTVVTTRDDLGAPAPIDLDRPSDAELTPILCKPRVLAHVAELLEEAEAELRVASPQFPFPLSPGFDHFDTPLRFVQVTRALAARVAIYRERWADALTALEGSFIQTDDAAPELARGIYHSFGTGSGDLLNGLVSPTLYAHPSLERDAEPGDRRLAKIRKVRGAEEGPSEVPGVFVYTDPDEELRSDLRFTLYPSPATPVAIIRNEELILIRAEAHLGLSRTASTTATSSAATARALADLNFIRRHAAGLPELVGPDDPRIKNGDLVEELLHQRRYSLLLEGGHRWVDMRRYGRLDRLPIDSVRHVVHARFPIPAAERDARSGALECVE